MKESIYQAPIGPNRWSDKLNIEQRFEFDENELDLISNHLPNLQTRLTNALAALGVDVARDFQLPAAPRVGAADHFGQVYAAAAIALQRCTGHDVNWSHSFEANYPAQCHCLYEYEHLDVGFRTGKIVLLILAELLPGLVLEDGRDDQRGFGLSGDYRVDFEALKVFAGDLILPRDTRAIWEAAQRLDIPCIHLEREPYEGLAGDFRVRKNGLLMLGQGRFQKVIDGTICPALSAHLLGFIHDRIKCLQLIQQTKFSALLSNYKYRKVRTINKAKQVADNWSYPLRLSAARETDDPILINNIDELQEVMTRLLGSHDELIMDQPPQGKTALLVFANKRPLGAILQGQDERHDESHVELHDSIISATTQLVARLGCGLVMFTIVSTDFSSPLAESGGAVTSVDFAPNLDKHLSEHESILNQAAEGFVRWMFPPGSQSRIQSVAITGTNGKTTTTRMIERILRQSGLNTGMVCSDGEFLNNKKQFLEPHQKVGNFQRQFESADIDVAVLEHWYGRIRNLGFAACHYDVCICTNVTAEHRRVYSVADVAGLRLVKRAVMLRAANAAVLNADDVNCLKMLPLKRCKKLFLTSLCKSEPQLRGQFGVDVALCVQESVKGESWIVLYDRDRIEVMPTSMIPATFDGAAQFNVSNAMQAICGAYAMGIDLAQIRTSLSGFAMNAENTPWRLNFYDQYPPQIVVDFAHNPDGVKSISEFVNKLEIAGKKIICFSADRSDEGIMDLARSAAGYFDYYVCKSYEPPEGKPRVNESGPDHILGLMRRSLLEAGEKKDNIATFITEMEGVDHALDVANEGDLVLLLLGYVGMPIIAEHLKHYYLQHEGQKSKDRCIEIKRDNDMLA